MPAPGLPPPGPPEPGSPEAVSPEALSPEALSPEALSPEAFSPEPGPRLPRFQRCAEVRRLSDALDRAGQRLDRVDPPPPAPDDPGLRPVLRPLPRPDRPVAGEDRR